MHFYFCLLFLLFAAQQTLAQVEEPVLKWKEKGWCESWGCETGWYSSPAIADDGSVIAASYKVVRLNGETGDAIWRTRSGHSASEGLDGNDAGRTWAGVVLTDMNADGQDDIVVAHGEGVLAQYDFMTGETDWEKEPFGDGRELRSLAVEDVIGGDSGRKEIAVGVARGSNQNCRLLEFDGDNIDGWPQRQDSTAGYTWGIYSDNIALGDIVSGNTHGEVLVPSDVHYVCLYTPNGEPIDADSELYGDRVWGEVGAYIDLEYEVLGYGPCSEERTLRTNFARGVAVVVDVDGDGTNEIVVTGNAHDCNDNQRDQYVTVWIWNADRTRWAHPTDASMDWSVVPTTGAPLSEDFNVIENVNWNPVVVDIDGDGMKEIIFPSYDGRLHCFWLDKSERHSWPLDIPGGPDFRFASEPVVADLDNDGRAEILVGTWPTKSSGQSGELLVISYRGEVLHRVPWKEDDGEYDGIIAPPTLGDIDSDGDLELVAVTVKSGVVAFDLPSSSDAVILWQTSRGSFKRNGFPVGGAISCGNDCDTDDDGSGNGNDGDDDAASALDLIPLFLSFSFALLSIAF